jgi:hypothetical protein
MALEIENIHKRLEQIENHNKNEMLSIIEILSNLSFFGELKQTACEFAVNGQCSCFTIDRTTCNRIPLVSECRIKNCQESKNHYHIELSKLSCGLCQNGQIKSQKRKFNTIIKAKRNKVKNKKRATKS